MIIGFDMFDDSQIVDNNISMGITSRIDIENTLINELKIDKNSTQSYNSNKQEWGLYTVFQDKFQDLNFEAGNISLNDGVPVEYLRIKKKKSDKTEWNTYIDIPYDSTQTEYNWSDKFVESLCEYDYTVVPVGQGGIESEYKIKSIFCDYEDIWILGSNGEQYHLIANLNMGEIQNVSESSLVTTLGSRFPYRIQNGNLKYRKCSVSAMLLSDCTLNNNTIDRSAEKVLRENFYDFLTNGLSKIYKESEGRYFLISIDTNTVKITPNNDLSRRIGTISFEFVEVGDVEDIQTLKTCGILS